MAGYYNPKKDYAAAIKAEKNPAKQAQLKAERQNKIDAMNAAGTNKKGYTNSIYGSSSGAVGKGNSSSSSGVSGSSGYFDKNLDYAAAIRNEKDPVKQAQLIAERQNKLNWMNASGTNTKGYTNDIYGGMPQASAPQGQYRSTEAALNNTNKAAIQPTATTQTQTAAAAEAENPTGADLLREHGRGAAGSPTGLHHETIRPPEGGERRGNLQRGREHEPSRPDAFKKLSAEIQRGEGGRRPRRHDSGAQGGREAEGQLQILSLGEQQRLRLRRERDRLGARFGGARRRAWEQDCRPIQPGDGDNDNIR